MVPAEFRLLEALPLTANGKVDRKALSAPIARPVQPAAEFVAPQTELEGMIAGIWQEILETNQVGVYDNFFDLGGNSLRMVLVHSRMIQSLGRDISVMTMFEHPTISAMARHLSQGQDKGPSFEPILDRVEKRKAALQSQRQRRSGHAA